MRIRSTITAPSTPALSAIRRAGSDRESRTILAPVASSPSRSILSSAASARISATPPPGTIPSSIAARVADSASSIRCFFSLSSTSVAAPTLTTATPPASFARRSWSFSRSQSESVLSISALIWLMRPLTSSWPPAPSTMVVSSLVTTTFLALPSRSSPTFSSFSPTSSLMTCPPVRVAMSWSIALRRSPNPGALTATTLNVPRILLTTSVASASPSTSSAISQQRPAGLEHLLQQREQLLDAADLLVHERDVRLLEDRLHALLVGDEVRRDVALVELHALDELELHAERVRLLHRHDPVLADLVERLGEHVADRWVGRRDRGHVGDVLARTHVLGLVLDRVDGHDDGLLDAALERHRVRAGRDVAHAAVDHRAGEHGRGRGAVTQPRRWSWWRPPSRAGRPCSPTGPRARPPWRS